MDLTQLAIEQAIATMWKRYDEPLSLDDIADSAIMSKFYFSRVFRTMTGTSPGRFLSAVRLYKAKHLLLQTPISVTSIAYMVGYNSLGTFTSRFGRSVGASPGRYRAKSEAGGHCVFDMARPAPTGWTGEVTGSVVIPESEDHAPLRTYIGLFSSPAIEGLPISCDIVDGPGTYTLRGVPAGNWYVRAAAIDLGEADPRPWVRKPEFLGAGDEVSVRPERAVIKQDLGMREATILDMPILLALPELDNFEAPREDRPVDRPVKSGANPMLAAVSR